MIHLNNIINIGTATVTVKFKGNYTGTKELTFKIVPAQATNLKASTVKKDSIKLTWTKAAGAKYYKVEQSTDGKTWKVIKTVDTNSYTVSKLTTTTKLTYTLSKLSGGKKIYVKVQAVNAYGKNSADSKVVNTTVKK